MASHYSALVSEIKNRLANDLLREQIDESEELIAVPYPYVVPGRDKDAFYYWDTYFINLALIRLKMVEQAKHNAENLVFLQRKYGYIPASTKKTMLNYSQIPLLPWIVRDVYRATGEKEWLDRMLPDVENEYNYWTSNPHTSPAGLFRFAASDEAKEKVALFAESESCWIHSSRFDQVQNYNPVDLNALLYRNGQLIYDLQIEATGGGQDNILQKSEQIQKLFDLCWDQSRIFYFDNNFAEKRLSPVKSLAGFVPLFAKMVDNERAKQVQQSLGDFMAPGGLTITDKAYDGSPSPWNYPYVCAPYIYFTTKGLSDHDFMEDAADIGTNWLDMVFDIYEQTGELWEWYNVKEKTHISNEGIQNTPIMGWTAGTFIALLDTLGLE